MTDASSRGDVPLKQAQTQAGPQTQPGDACYYEMLEQLQAVDFVLLELNLYLDTHPGDLKSIEQYNKMAQERMILARRFEELYGPLTHYGHSFSRYPFQWPQAPWPWQV
ncbi:spore coat protein CotJB [Paenibacillus sp. F411]|uniref:CotJB protein n=1 Tax=Paenibacillus algicola TaxID=2565926 RepID=A0A4P8XSI4_9BACL|nr:MULTISPECIES: spore coat protein CotJB [Paenibacillus]MBO2942465.1 spore coat protein CotJB [Paenibacillus sp. F411]QCT03599.1 CotJB protein [Paenibacillus algicola]